MKPNFINNIENEKSSHNAITLFLRWFLLRDTLTLDEKVAKLLNDMDQGEVKNEGEWAESIRRALLPQVVGVLSSILERPMKPEEMLYVFGKIDEFIYRYGVRDHEKEVSNN